MLKKAILSLLLLLVVFYFYACYGRKNRILSKEEVKQLYCTPDSKFFKWNGVDVHYTDAGKGIPVLMIHGFGGSVYDFYMLDSLIRDQYRVIRVDLPGFGLSDFPTTKDPNPDFYSAYSEFFKVFMDTLHVDTAYVMGNSLGGSMAWNLCVQHPEVFKKLVLFNSAGYEMDKVIKSANANLLRNDFVKNVTQKGLPELFTRIAVQRIFYNQNSIDKKTIKRMNDLWNRDGNLNHVLAIANSEKFLDTALIKTISCPTLIIWGKQDNIIPVGHTNRFHRDIKNSTEIIYDSCGHVPMMERPLDVKRDVLKFLQK